jgi:hypothetical protein
MDQISHAIVDNAIQLITQAAREIRGQLEQLSRDVITAYNRNRPQTVEERKEVKEITEDQQMLPTEEALISNPLVNPAPETKNLIDDTDMASDTSDIDLDPQTEPANVDTDMLDAPRPLPAVPSAPSSNIAPVSGQSVEVKAPQIASGDQSISSGSQATEIQLPGGSVSQNTAATQANLQENLYEKEKLIMDAEKAEAEFLQRKKEGIVNREDLDRLFGLLAKTRKKHVFFSSILEISGDRQSLGMFVMAAYSAIDEMDGASDETKKTLGFGLSMLTNPIKNPMNSLIPGILLAIETAQDLPELVRARFPRSVATRASLLDTIYSFWMYSSAQASLIDYDRTWSSLITKRDAPRGVRNQALVNIPPNRLAANASLRLMADLSGRFLLTREELDELQVGPIKNRIANLTQISGTLHREAALYIIRAYSLLKDRPTASDDIAEVANLLNQKPPFLKSRSIVVFLERLVAFDNTVLLPLQEIQAPGGTTIYTGNEGVSQNHRTFMLDFWYLAVLAKQLVTFRLCPCDALVHPGPDNSVVYSWGNDQFCSYILDLAYVMFVAV